MKPGFFKNEYLAELDPIARLLFIGLWTLADREGRLENRPIRIKGELFPYENINVEPHLDGLERTGFILRYEVDGKKYIQIINFKKHQNPHNRETASIIPPPSNNLGRDKAQPSTGQVITLAVPSRADSFNPITDSLNQGRTKRASTAPDEFEITDDLKTWAKEQGLSLGVLENETAKFLDHHRAKGSTFKDWKAAWRKWMRNHKEWNKPKDTFEGAI